MKQFKLIAILVLTLTAMSCDRVMRDNIYVEKVEDSDDSDYLYRVTFDSDVSDGVFYYTNHKYEVGDTLASVGEFNGAITAINSRYNIISDSLRLENEKLMKKNNELTIYNEILMGIVKDNLNKVEDK